MDERTEWSEADKAAYRRFVRTHHPDVGGDPDVFAAGLREFRRGRRDENAAGTEPAPRGESLVFVRRSRGVPRLLAAFAERRRRKRNPRVR
ncbi:hypothetical protein L3Q65_05885 [Amycolatopsis sp. FU40]|uniref:hypothetical protein n=1 Tax=Amycolatopsis sp. FU40 TaxID=2914159 RepID=UPI001F3E7E79|nr:hypothetical protein [Amycolatopsis sp. FU40]UKD56247.1 hypothetical protein L3Q65_05885 [Amycolatopsis sp. FU40]